MFIFFLVALGIVVNCQIGWQISKLYVRFYELRGEDKSILVGCMVLLWAMIVPIHLFYRLMTAAVLMPDRTVTRVRAWRERVAAEKAAVVTATTGVDVPEVLVQSAAAEIEQIQAQMAKLSARLEELRRHPDSARV